MTVLADDALQVVLPPGAVGRKFDDAAVHGLSHCMKAVDFIVELDDRLLFIEFKDPDHPLANAKDRDRFIRKFLGGQIDGDLKTKFRDSFLYEWASGRVDKPIYFLVLIGAAELSDADLLVRSDALASQLPVLGPRNTPWVRPFVAGCAVMNLAAWNAALPQFPASRISA